MKLAVFCPNWIGDAVMATPTLRALRKQFPDAHITGLMKAPIAETLAGGNWFNEVLLFDHKSKDPKDRTWNVIQTLRRQRYDVGVLLTNSIRTALVAWLGGVHRRLGYARDGRGVFLNDRLWAPRAHGRYQPSPIIDYYLALAYRLGAPTESYRLELFTNPDDERRADALWGKFGFSATDKVVTLNPGAAFGPAKRWPSQSFAKLAQRMVDQFHTKVVVLCGPSERGFARFIADAAMRPRHVKSLADEDISLGLSKALVRRSALMVSNDTGPRHFAAAFDVPVVSLFGPTHIQWTDTYFAKEDKLQLKMPCGPCQQRECPLGHLKCMNDLTVDQVYASASRWLSPGAQRMAG